MTAGGKYCEELPQSTGMDYGLTYSML